MIHIARLSLLLVLLSANEWAIGNESPSVERTPIFTIEAMTADEASALEDASAQIDGRWRAQIVWENGRFKLLIGTYTDERQASRIALQVRDLFPGAFARRVHEPPRPAHRTRTAFLETRPQPSDPGWTNRRVEKERFQADLAMPQVHLVRSVSQTARSLLPDPDIPVADTKARICEEAKEGPAVHLPDERPLWALLASGRIAEIETEIGELSESYPQWSPSRDLLQVLDQKRLDRSFDQAIRDEEWARLIELSETHPERLHCGRIDLLWNLARAYAMEEAPYDAALIYRRIIPHCPNAKHRLSTLEKARAYLTNEEMSDLIRREESAVRSENEQSAFGDFRYDFYRALVFDESKTARRETIVDRIEEIRDGAIARRDGDIAMLAGWTYHALDADASALEWFARAESWSASSNRREEAAFGMSRSLREMGRTADEIALLEQWRSRSERMASILLQRYGECADIAFAEKDYLGVLNHFERIEKDAELSPERMRVKAWSLFHLGEFDEAAHHFEKLYRSEPDLELADGLDASLSKIQAWTRLERLAETLSGPLQERWNRRLAAREASEKLFLLAASHAGPDQENLRALDSASGALGFAARTKSGSRGTSFLQLEKLPALRSEWIVGSIDTVVLKVDRIRLDNGVETLDEGVEVDLRYQREGWTSLYASLGRTSSGGAVSPRMTFSVGANRRSRPRDDRRPAQWAVEFSARPLRETILSYTGMVDADTGLAWGGVLQTGVIGDHSRQVGGDWTLSAHFEWSALNGRRVESNQRQSLYASLSRNVAVENFDFLSVGPYLYLDRFAKDSSGFALGDGGYFSPRALVQAGLAANLQSRENRPYILRARASVGFQQQRRHDGSEESGPTFTLDGEALWKISGHLHVGAGVSFRRTAGYDDRSFQLIFALSEKDRRSLFSRDFAPLAPESLY